MKRSLTRRYDTAVTSPSSAGGRGVGFLGPNGSGKTTTLLMLLGLTEPTEGSAQVLGCDPVRQPLEIKRQVGYLPENVGFYDDLTARENLEYVARLNRIPAAAARQSIGEALGQVGLGEVGEKRAGLFSRGMRQRLGLAELLIKNPKLVFLDEPTLGLDPDGITKSSIDPCAAEPRPGHRGAPPTCSTRCSAPSRGIMMKGRMVATGTIGERPDARPADEAGETLSRFTRYFQEA